MPIGIQPHVHPLQSALQANQFLIPVYQRNYEWTHDHWKDLWDDLLYAKATNSWIQMEEVVTDVERAFGEEGDLTDFMMRWGILVGGDQFGRYKTSTQLQIILDGRIRDRSQTATEADLRQVTADVTEEFIREMSSYRRAYKTLRLPDSLPGDAAVLRAKLQRAQGLGVGMASDPLVLYLLRQWQANRHSEAAVLRCLNMLESYTVRRYLCRYNAKSDNRVFAAIAHSLYQSQVTGDQLTQALLSVKRERNSRIQTFRWSTFYHGKR